MNSTLLHCLFEFRLSENFLSLQKKISYEFNLIITGSIRSVWFRGHSLYFLFVYNFPSRNGGKTRFAIYEDV